eukprot:g2285.t1
MSECVNTILDNLYARHPHLGRRYAAAVRGTDVFFPPSDPIKMRTAANEFCFENRRCRDELLLSLGYDVSTEPPPNHRVVLMWNPTYLDKSWSGPSWQGDWIYRSCEYSSCWNTVDRAELPRSDVVWFNCAYLPNATDYPTFLKDDPQRPKTVFSCFESPLFVHARCVLDRRHTHFDWMMTQNFDGDVSAAWQFSDTSFRGGGVKGLLNYGKTRRHLTLPIKRERGAFISWMVSNCKTPSRREVFVRDLRRHVEVDVFGSEPCLLDDDDDDVRVSLKDECPNDSRSRPDDACVDKIMQRYHFYLALENSICRDYVTEKFWNALRRSIVPVVFAGDWYDDLIPKGYKVFVRASDFPSTQALAEYLRQVRNDEQLYREYFRWREVPVDELPKEFRERIVDAEMPWCSLCRKIHEEALTTTENDVPRDVSVWYGPDRLCAPNQDDCCWL